MEGGDGMPQPIVVEAISIYSGASCTNTRVCKVLSLLFNRV